MFQSWKHLLFLHWQIEPDDIQRTLPEGLSVDTYDGAAWIGVVPFFMQNIRPRFCPKVPWLSNFLELNVRTYVRDQSGRPGVWFYSLDCNQAIAVTIARTIFHLPYFRAAMRAQVGPSSEMIYYDSRRAGDRTNSHFEFRSLGPGVRTRAGSLEAFLVERYRLFSCRGDKLYSGEVWHTPYEISQAETPQWSTHPLTLAGFSQIHSVPDHAAASTGVDVSIYPLRRVI